MCLWLKQRASRSAFEGFSQAREEYDKEVAARREVEAAMDELRTTFTEQAMRLAAFDKDQRNSEMLKSKSKELRVSVVGMEKHLSALKAEVELETAHMEELNKKNDGRLVFFFASRLGLGVLEAGSVQDGV